jgi:hypothetical protein
MIMSWTDLNTVKTHLMQSEIATGTVEDEEHTLWGSDEVQLNTALITPDSETIKTIDLNEPYDQGGMVLSAHNWAAFDHSNIVPESVVVSSDIHRTTIYIEGTDYVLEYNAGKIRRVEGSSIPSGDTVYIWYLYYTEQVKDTDYVIDYETGTLSRIPGGSIADGGIVYVDYTTSASTIPDALISEAITEAEDKILSRLSDAYNASSTDQGLVTGATELTISIICNAKAMDIMNRLHNASADDLAGQWREMSNRYEIQAWKTLSRFLATPGIRAARTQINQSLYL